jgi:hypothetical protein
MNKEILDPKVHYYTDAIEDFDTFKRVWKELDTLEQYADSGVNVWSPWTSSNDKTFIYGETKTFNISAIEKLSGEVAEKSKYIYDAIMATMYNVCKDYASSLGDFDEPRLFPTFNIKKYNTGMGMGAHFDQLDGDKTLRYSLVMYLNDDCEGGEISFKLSDYQKSEKFSSPSLDYDVALATNQIDFGLKPKANSVIIFPSFPPYFHTAHVVKSGFKYMIPGHWIHNNMELNKNQSM